MESPRQLRIRLAQALRRCQQAEHNVEQLTGKLRQTQRQLAVLLHEKLQQPTAPIASPIDFDGSAILVVDDNSLNIDLVSACLEGYNLRLFTCASGEAALERVALENPALILMDMQMPGWDGLETCRRIRQAQAQEDKLVILALSANYAPEEIAAALAAGMQGYLAKPLDIDALFNALCQHLPYHPVEVDENRKSPATLVLRADNPHCATTQQTPMTAETWATRQTNEETIAGVDLPDALKRLRGNRKLFNEVFTAFAANCQNISTELQVALDTQDQDRLTRIFHRIKGTAANLSAYHLAHVAGTLEEKSKQNLPLTTDALDAFAAALTQIISSAQNVAQATVPLVSAPSAQTDTLELRALAQAIFTQVDIDLGAAEDAVELFVEASRNTSEAAFAHAMRAQFYRFDMATLKIQIQSWLELRSSCNDQ